MIHTILALPPLLVGIATAIGGLASAAGTVASLANKPKTPPLPATPAQPTPVQQPTGAPGGNVPVSSPSFLAAAAGPSSQNTASKTLLGQ